MPTLDFHTVLALGAAIAALLTLACLLLTPSLGGNRATWWQGLGNLAFTAMFVVRLWLDVPPSPVGYATIWSLLLLANAGYAQVMEHALDTPVGHRKAGLWALAAGLCALWGALAAFETAHAGAIVAGAVGTAIYVRAALVAWRLQGRHLALPRGTLVACFATSAVFSAKHCLDRYAELRDGIATVVPTASTYFGAVLLFLMINIGVLLLLYLGLAERVRRLARTDELTGALNRRGLAERLAERTGPNAGAVLLIDIDHFKAVNDTHGHAVGDEVLRWFAQTVRRYLRSDDLLVRMGGEEFCVVLPGMDELQAQRIAERIRVDFESHGAAVTTAGPVRITASFGLADYGPEDIALDVRLQQADEALYAAKRSGRNRVVRWTPEHAQLVPV